MSNCNGNVSIARWSMTYWLISSGITTSSEPQSTNLMKSSGFDPHVC